jgi:hypothetical protein
MIMDTVVPVLIWSCILAAIVVPALIGIKLFSNGAAERSSSALVFKAAVALVAWLILTAGLFVMWAVLAYVVPHALSSDPTAEWRPTPAYVGMHVVYVLVGCGLVYWVWRQARIKLS